MFLSVTPPVVMVRQVPVAPCGGLRTVLSRRAIPGEQHRFTRNWWVPDIAV
jgi:hypothetical protein